MKQRYFILSASIAAALAGAPAALLAQPDASGNTVEAPRVTQTVSNNNLFTIPKTHLAFVGTAKGATSAPLAGSTAMNHLQLILKPSVERQAAMEAFIANQHNPKSAQFHKWLTPQQFGEQFGVADTDITAVTSWLTAQGFTVNNVYPNKTQIDFSGTAAQVNQAFHTQENLYTNNQVTHLSNASDISIPTALKSVVAGVMGLNDFHAAALNTKSKSTVAKWDASKKSFTAKNAPTNSKGMAIPFPRFNNLGTMRGLAPNDMATMYGIKTIRANGVTGKGITIAVVEDYDMQPGDWTNFVTQFNLGQYGGTFSQINPEPTTGTANCTDPALNIFGESVETVLDAEWSTAIAPGANIVVATCSDYAPGSFYLPSTPNHFGGVFLAATNLINGSNLPNIISASYGDGEYNTDAASKTAIDLMWAQADAEGISVFVSSGDYGPSFNGALAGGYAGNTALDTNSLATSPHVTAVGGTDLADILDGTTSQYFAATPSAVGGSALSYVPEIPWNASCGNGVAATDQGFSSALALCQDDMKWDPAGNYWTSAAGGGGASAVDAKPVWQQQVFNAAPDKSRDLPDVALFAGSYGNDTAVITCTSYYPCTPNWSGTVELVQGTSLSSPMFAGIQALMDQGLAARGVTANQGNAAPTLYALAAQEYGGPTGTAPASLATCNANNGATGTSSCVFHNVTRGSISSQCGEFQQEPFIANCYIYGATNNYINFLGTGLVGLITTDAAPTSYGVSNKAYGAQPGWSFAAGLGSVNATNLLIAWRAYVQAPPAP
jgi:subtilase family serine protease